MACRTCRATTRRRRTRSAADGRARGRVADRRGARHPQAFRRPPCPEGRRPGGGRERELVFVIGPSGSGKSTLLRCLNRLEEPSSGCVTVDGVDMLDPRTDINHARQRIGMVFQSFNLYPHMTALGNVTLALRKVQGRAREAEALGAGGARRASAWPTAPATPAAALRRPAAARRHRARHRARTARDAVRRTDQRARPRTGGRRAGRDARTARKRHDHGGGQPRDGLRQAPPPTAWSSWTTGHHRGGRAGRDLREARHERTRAFIGQIQRH